MIVMGIDQSMSRTGYAVIDFKGVDDFKYLVVGSIKPTKDLEFPEDKMIQISRKLLFEAGELNVDYVVMENLFTPRLNSMDTVQKLSGLYYVIMCELRKQNYLVMNPRPSEWKSNLGINGGKRAEQKEKSIAKAKELLKGSIWEICDAPNDDEADAICLAMYGALADIEGENDE